MTKVNRIPSLEELYAPVDKGFDHVNQATPDPSSPSQRVLEIAKEWMRIFVGKNTDYGASYLLTGATLNLWFPQGFVIRNTLQQTYFGLLTRMLDKIIRTSHLVFMNRGPLVIEEKAYQTIADLGVYAFMTADLLKHETANTER